MDHPRLMGSYVDDPTIANESVLLRRIPPRHFVYDENLERWRPKSAAFDDHPSGTPMSVVLAEVLEQSGRTPRDALAGHQDYALAGFRAGEARALHQGVVREPLIEEPAHAVVFGKKTQSVRRKLAKLSTWILPPPQLDR